MTIDETIKQKIFEQGPLPFSQYMQIALYDPEQGFYADGGAGRKKDFITSSESGPLFGKLVSKAIDQLWVQLGSPNNFTFLECGAGPGTLARSILRSELNCRKALQYVAVETSELQRNEHPTEVESMETMPSKIENGIVFANELLDNLPFDIFESGEAGTWKEVRVGTQDGSLTEVITPAIEAKPEFTVNEIGIRVPSQRAAQEWLKTALETLSNGQIIIIDYAVEEYPCSSHRNWLRTYMQHQQSDDPLLNPGAKDITCDVDISQLGRVRQPSSIRTQRQWLIELGIETFVTEGKEYWLQNAHKPDLAAIEARSRVTESEALLDANGLGGFKVIEWEVKSSL